MIIKVCGMRDAANIRAVEAAGPDWMGFIFYPKSKRYAGCQKPQYLPACKRVGVFVNMALQEIKEFTAEWCLEAVQLHGHESPELCKELRQGGLEVIKAFSIGNDGLPADIAAYEEVCDYFLFDTACAGYGGSGRTFDWSLVMSYTGRVPFLLSGGLNPGLEEEIRAFSHSRFAGIDLNSGFEIAPAFKDEEKIRTFIKALR